MKLPVLPAVQFADTDPASVETVLITTAETLLDTTLYPADPFRLFLSSLAYLIASQNALIDQAGKQTLLLYAEKSHLDHQGVLMDTPRLSVTAATTTLRFQIPAPLEWDVPIPAGSRVTTAGRRVARSETAPFVLSAEPTSAAAQDNSLTFATDTEAVIASGQTEATVTATATTVGNAGNGLVAGQINRMVDPLAYVDTVKNITTSSGGADTETDDPYRLRIAMAPEKFSTAGPIEAYRYHVLSAHPQIADVVVLRLTPGIVDVRVILIDGALPDPNLLEQVQQSLSARNRRPLNDTVRVKAADVVDYDLDLSWSVSGDNATMITTVEAKVRAAITAVTGRWASVFGCDLDPTDLVAAARAAGAKRVEVKAPAYTPLPEGSIARARSLTLRYLGVDHG